MRLMDAVMTRLLGPIEPPPRDDLMTIGGLVLRALPELEGRRHALRVSRIVLVAATIHAGRTGEPLFPDAFEATTMGPLVPRLYQDLRRHAPRCLAEHHRRPSTHRLAGSLQEAISMTRRLTDGELLALVQGEGSGWRARYRNRTHVDRGPTMTTDDLVRHHRAMTTRTAA